MLAFMPRSSPLPDLHAPFSMGNSTMSVALLPSSPMTYGQPAPALPAYPSSGPSPSKRPRLSLTTSNITSEFGKGSTSLRLETLSATSPTARNTFQNAHTPQSSQPPTSDSKKPILAPLKTNLGLQREQTPTPARIQPPESPTLSPSSPASVSTLDSLPSDPPYKLPFNASSILTNGPIPRSTSRRMSFAQSRPMFPTPKKVLFKAPLTEEIKTTKYTLRHSDIESDGSSPPPEKPSNESAATAGAETFENEVTKAVGNAAPTSPQVGDKRESDEETEYESAPVTPVAGRRKRHRQWRWTLAPISPNSGIEREHEAEDGKAGTESVGTFIDL